MIEQADKAREYGIYVDSCGCCSGVWISEEKSNWEIDSNIEQLTKDITENW